MGYFWEQRRMASMAANLSQHVVIVDDDPVTTKVVRLILEDEGYATTILHRGNAVVEAVTGQETDLVILDVNLPDVDGFSVTQHLRARRYHGAIILLTGRSSVADIVHGFKLGADDYVTKPYEPLELLARVENVIRRTSQVDQRPLGSVLQIGDAELSLSELTYRSDAVQPVLLTPTEMRILEILMRNNWKVISRETLIDRIWGIDFVGDTNRVDVYIRRVRRKIEPNPRQPRYLHTVRGVGYVFREESEEIAVA
jgi:two-component system, OmpR family, response regulator RegX3